MLFFSYCFPSYIRKQCYLQLMWAFPALSRSPRASCCLATTKHVLQTHLHQSNENLRFYYPPECPGHYASYLFGYPPHPRTASYQRRYSSCYRPNAALVVYPRAALPRTSTPQADAHRMFYAYPGILAQPFGSRPCRYTALGFSRKVRKFCRLMTPSTTATREQHAT
jgi:hypothetical protein